MKNQPKAVDQWPIVHCAGDTALLVEFGDVYTPQINNAVMAFEKYIGENIVPGVIEIAPTIRSVLIRFDPLELSHVKISHWCRTIIEMQDWYGAPPPSNVATWRIPAVYGGESGPDLAEVADLLGKREDQVIDEHCAVEMSVLMLGFAPGLAHLGQLPEAWSLPRKTSIRPQVPPGSLLVAIRQTVFTSTDIPTGWLYIATSPFHSFDKTAVPPFRLSPGDKVTFEPMKAEDFSRFSIGDFLAAQST